MKHAASVLVGLSVAMAGVGCQETPQADHRRVSAQTQEKWEKELQDRMAMTEQYLSPYRTNGLVTFKLQPAPAAVYIDDGEIGTDLSNLLIPAGAYRVKAVWPDGKSVEKKIFVLPALQAPPSYNWQFEESGSGGKSNVNFNASLHKTEIALNKPE